MSAMMEGDKVLWDDSKYVCNMQMVRSAGDPCCPCLPRWSCMDQEVQVHQRGPSGVHSIPSKERHCCHTKDVEGPRSGHEPLSVPACAPVLSGSSGVVEGEGGGCIAPGRPWARGTPVPSLMEGLLPPGMGKADGCSSLRSSALPPRSYCLRAGMPHLLLDHIRVLLVSSPGCTSKPKEREI